MKETRIRVPTPKDIFRSNFGKHFLKAHKEFFLASASIPNTGDKKIEEYEIKTEEGKRRK